MPNTIFSDAPQSDSSRPALALRRAFNYQEDFLSKPLTDLDCPISSKHLTNCKDVPNTRTRVVKQFNTVGCTVRKLDHEHTTLESAGVGLLSGIPMPLSILISTHPNSFNSTLKLTHQVLITYVTWNQAYSTYEYEYSLILSRPFRRSITIKKSIWKRFVGSQLQLLNFCIA